jgi:hypothetical protein
MCWDNYQASRDENAYNNEELPANCGLFVRIADGLVVAIEAAFVWGDPFMENQQRDG